MLRSILIARSSKDRNDVSCESQIFEMKEEAIRKQEIVVDTYKFPKVRHFEILEDPTFQEILAEVKSKNRTWSKIWFYDTSRISRSPVNAYQIKALLSKCGVELSFLKTPTTGEEAFDNLIHGLMVIIDQFQSQYAKAGSIRGQKQNIREGYRAGGSAPYGYRLKRHIKGIDKFGNETYKSTLEADPETFKNVREYLERRADGESRGSIFKDFNDRNIPPPRKGRYWRDSSGKAIEENLLVYQGHLVYNRHNERENKKSYKGNRKWRERSEWEIKENAHERCISDETANKIDHQLQTNKSKHANPGPKKYLLTDILFCAECGNRMVGNSGYYACMHKILNKGLCTNSNISSDHLNRCILTYLKENLIQKKFYDNFIKAIQAQYENYKRDSIKDQAENQKNITDIKKKIDKIMDLYMDGKIDKLILESKLVPLQEEEKELEVRALDLSQVNLVLNAKLSEFAAGNIAEQLDRFETMLNDDNEPEMRLLVRDFIRKITIGPKEEPKSKKWKRRVHIESYVRALTMILVASPRGFEPLLPT